MITNNIGKFASEQQFFSKTKTSLATSLGPTERKTLSLQVLTRSNSVSHLAQNYQVSRKFLYRQGAIPFHETGLCPSSRGTSY